MDSSNYRDLITIYNQQETSNNYGTNLVNWVEAGKRLAEAQPLKGDLLLQAGQLRPGIPYEFKLYYEKDLAITDESKIVFRNLEFVIHTLYPIDQDYQELYVLAFGQKIKSTFVDTTLESKLDYKLIY